MTATWCVCAWVDEDKCIDIEWYKCYVQVHTLLHLKSLDRLKLEWNKWGRGLDLIQAMKVMSNWMISWERVDFTADFK